MQSKDLLNASVRWRIGDGSLINVCGDQWLPNEDNFFHLDSLIDDLYEFKVPGLIHEGGGGRGWNEHLLSKLFIMEDVQTILQISLHITSRKDRRI